MLDGLNNIEFIDTSYEGWDKGFCGYNFPDNYSGHFINCSNNAKYAFIQKDIELDETITLKPNLNTNYKKLSFEDWLNEVICKINPNIEFSRYDIILILCNKDGGAHYEKDDLYIIEDEKYEKYSFLKKNDSLNIIIDGKEPVSNNIPLYPIIRQIAFEVIETLESHYQDYVKCKI